VWQETVNKKESLADLNDKAACLSLVNRILSEPYVPHCDQQLSPHEIDLDKCTSLGDTSDQIYSPYAQLFNKDVCGDKTPSCGTHIHIVNRMFPNCRFLHIIRDGRDAALSPIQQWCGPDDFVSALRYWAETVTCTRKMLRMLPDSRYTELRFEDLVVNPDKELRRVTDFLGLEVEPGMLTNYPKKASRKSWQ
jgi:hypothetical protein